MVRAGEFAEAVRSQFMDERMDYFRAVEAALYDATAFQVRCLLRSEIPDQITQ